MRKFLSFLLIALLTALPAQAQMAWLANGPDQAIPFNNHGQLGWINWTNGCVLQYQTGTAVGTTNGTPFCGTFTIPNNSITGPMLVAGAAAANLGADLGTSGAVLCLLNSSCTWSGAQTFAGGAKAAVTNPAVPGWGVSFNPPAATGYNNLHAYTVYLNGGATAPTQNMLLNTIVNSGYSCTVGSGTTPNCSSSTPLAVGFNSELQINGGGGNDNWANLGVLDIQTPLSSGGNATAGIVRGNWTGTILAAGLRAQAENYTGRAAYGVAVGSSQASPGGAFDNSFLYGVFVHSAKQYGVVVGGLEGGLTADLPSSPFAFVNANSTATLWAVNNNGGTSASQIVIGDITISKPSGNAFMVYNGAEQEFAINSSGNVYVRGTIQSGSGMVNQSGTEVQLAFTGAVTGGTALSLVSQGSGLPPYFSTPSDFIVRSSGSGYFDFNHPTQTTSPSAGGAGALPATPAGYAKMKINGTIRLFPYY